MGHKVETANVGCKVLPICDGAQTNSNAGDCGDASGNDFAQQKSQQRKAVSRMKELLRRAAAAAAAKSPKRPSKGWKVLHFKSKVVVKDQLEDSSSTYSSKLSFAWDATSCSAASSVHSPLHIECRDGLMLAKNLSRLSITSQSTERDISRFPSPRSDDYVRNGQWITTDSDFVVLEL